jgi:hypothetical protein
MFSLVTTHVLTQGECHAVSVTAQIPRAQPGDYRNPDYWRVRREGAAAEPRRPPEWEP